jgi:hypothetical protein
VDAKSNKSHNDRLIIPFIEKKVKQNKKASSEGGDTEKSSFKRPAGTSPVSIIKEY